MIYRILNIIFFLMFTIFLGGQESIFITYLQDSAAVGETVGLMITTEKNPTSITSFQLKSIEDITFFPPTTANNDSLKTDVADIAVRSLGLWEDRNEDGTLEGDELQWEEINDGDVTMYRNVIELAFYDVGIYMFDGFDFSIAGNLSKTNRVLQKITFKDYDLEVVDSTGLAPIKNIEREPFRLQDFIPIILYILVPILLLYLGYRFYKSRANENIPTEEPPEIIIPPHVKAMTALKELRSKELWQKGQIKDYQSELSYIIRSYLEGRYGIKALENTTRQIINSIKDGSFQEKDELKLSRILQISDLVKFAKAKPDVNIHEEFMDDAISFVENTKHVETIESEEE